jgi:hypothetical protein
MIYELWSTETDRLLGSVEVGYVDEAIGTRVPLRLKMPIDWCDGKRYNAVEALVCKMKINKKEYWALETNLPFFLVQKIDGFAPKLERPSLEQMFYLNRHE